MVGATSFLFLLLLPYWFLGQFAMPTARPGGSTTRVNNYAHDIQRAFYSSYLRRHGLKAHIVYLQIGIIGSVFITKLWYHDNRVQNISGLMSIWLVFLEESLLEVCLLHCIVMEYLVF